jgi:hypothetical protein
VLHVVHDALIIIGCYHEGRMRPKGSQPNVNGTTVRRVTVAEAARFLDVSTDAVGSWIQRGTLDSIKVDGTVYVLVDADHLHSNDDRASDDIRFLEGLRDQVVAIREQLDQERETNRDTRRIIAILAESAPKPLLPHKPESPGRWSEVELIYRRSDDVPGRGPKRSWWRKLLGA